MRDKKRIKRILKQVEKLWNMSPDQRFGQLLINLYIADDNHRLWSNEDEGLEQRLKFQIDERRSK